MTARRKARTGARWVSFGNKSLSYRRHAAGFFPRKAPSFIVNADTLNPVPVRNFDPCCQGTPIRIAQRRVFTA